jgi:hypothetical protein
MLGNTFSIGKKWTEIEKKEIAERSKKMWTENPEKLKSMAEKMSVLKKGVSIWEHKVHPMKGKVHPNRKYIFVLKDGVLIDKCYGIKEVCDKYNLDIAAVSRVCKNKSKTTKGFVLQYVL